MERIISLARAMRVKYLEHGTSLLEPLPINATKLLNVIGEDTGYSIATKIVADLQHLRGLLVRLPRKNALILISDTNNECWQRFTVVKEASHLFTETNESDFNVDAYSQARSLVDMELEFEDINLLIREVNGVMAAIELLIPDSMRLKVAHMYNVEKKTTYEIAETFMVPQKYMEHKMLADWGIHINSPH